VALANKEALVCAGALVTPRLPRARAAAAGGQRAQRDLQVLGDVNRVARLTLTASGGPFRNGPGRDARRDTAQAVKHPNWSMGAKISVDSATLMNKGLELIEAHHLFGGSGAAGVLCTPVRVHGWWSISTARCWAARAGRHARADRPCAGLA
jgi:1-deoxy-D-xylulose-5-phosphate reductoisomerase